MVSVLNTCMRSNVDRRRQHGFTLIELVCVIVLVSVLSIALFNRLNFVNDAGVQAGRDDLIAALFFAQQTAMARDNIQVVITSTAVSVREGVVPAAIRGYPINFPAGVSATAATFNYDKLGHTTSSTITLTKAGTTATVKVEASGYAHSIP